MSDANNDTNRVVECSQDIPASAEAVWHWVGDSGSILDWLPSGATGTIEVHGEGVGALRDLDLNVVGKVQHKLVAYDKDSRSLTYLLTKGQPLGMLKYQVRVTVVSTGDNTCRLDWFGEFEGDPSFDLDEMAANLKGSYDGMAEGLTRLTAS